MTNNNKRRKIVLIGAGSAMFSRGLISDLIKSSGLGPWELGLVDIDPEALEAIEGLAEKMIDQKNADIKISASTERKDILPDSDIVVTMIGVGGRKAWEKDVQIPREYGVYQPVGDSVMAGGISRALRMIPPMVEIAEDVKKFCPDAFFFNYANPMTAICRAVNKVTDVNMTGLCVGVDLTISYLAEILELPRKDISALWAGVNHFTLIYDLRYKGENLWPRFRKKVEEHREKQANITPGKKFSEMGETPETNNIVQEHPFSLEIFNHYGAFPAVLDRHVVEFFPERFSDGQYQGHTLGVDTFSVEKTLEHGDEIYEEIVAEGTKDGPLSPDFFGKTEGEHSELINILKSIYYDTRDIYSVNKPNKGTVSSIFDNAILETPGVATAEGFKTLKLDFPDHLAAIINKNLGPIELTVEAGLKGSRKLFVEALLADGSLNDRNKAEKMAEELLCAHDEYLPQF